MIWRAQVRDWLTTLMREFSVTAADVERRAKVSQPTLSRMLNEDSPHEPSIGSVMRVASAFGVDPPGAARATEFKGLREGDAQEWRGEPPEDVRPRTPNQSLWKVENRSLDLVGILPGDLLLLDAEEQPRPGDVVVAQVYDFDRGSARTRIRHFDGSFLTVRTTDPVLVEPPIQVHSAVRIIGPVVSVSRKLR